jgi:hypothetical protein
MAVMTNNVPKRHFGTNRITSRRLAF